MTASGEDAQWAALPVAVRDFATATPAPEFIEVYVVDVNGVLRGKRLPLSAVPRLYRDGLALPASTLLLDIQGHDVDATGLINDTGDSDNICWPVADSLRPLPWSPRPAGQLFLHMHTPAGEPFTGDPRTLLQGILERYRARGLRPVVAPELEFYLFDPEPDAHGRPRGTAASRRFGERSQIFGFADLARMDGFIADVRAACRAQNIPLDAFNAEQGDAQYELNLTHVDDVLLAADRAVLFKRTIKACAEQHGMAASFMAKPFGDAAGNGLHFHVSLLDGEGRNVFSQDGRPAPLMLHAVAGLLASMPDCTAIFAPHANSYRRFQPNSHAPMTATWGLGNRTAALRLLCAEPAATRIEHRVSGADANPYLVLAAILGGMDYGMARQLPAPQGMHGDATSQGTRALPDTWGKALDAFEQSEFIDEYLGADYRRWFIACKRQEFEDLRRRVPLEEYELYLRTV